MSEYRPRLSIEITEEQQAFLRKYLPHGMQKTVFTVILSDLQRVFERGKGPELIGAIMSKHLSLTHLYNVESPDGDNRRLE